MARGDSDAHAGQHEHDHNHDHSNEAELHVEPLVKLVNEKLAAHGGGPFIQGPFGDAADGADSELDPNRAVVTGRLGGRAVTLSFHVNSGKADHAYVVSFVDDATGTELGGGAAQSTFSDSISAYRWDTALQELAAL